MFKITVLISALILAVSLLIFWIMSSRDNVFLSPKFEYTVRQSSVEEIFRTAGVPFDEITIGQSHSPTGGTGFSRKGEGILLYDMLLKDLGNADYEIVFYINPSQVDLEGMNESDKQSLNAGIVKHLEIELIARLLYRYTQLETGMCAGEPCGDINFVIVDQND